ncbi:hypothetical protein PoB_004941800, partial [Plakobranchus ocellatus]
IITLTGQVETVAQPTPAQPAPHSIVLNFVTLVLVSSNSIFAKSGEILVADCSNHNTGEACHSYAEQPVFTAQVPTPFPEEKVLVVSLPSEMAELA